jgi:hypothetical protein
MLDVKITWFLPQLIYPDPLKILMFALKWIVVVLLQVVPLKIVEVFLAPTP